MINVRTSRPRLRWLRRIAHAIVHRRHRDAELRVGHAADPKAGLRVGRARVAGLARRVDALDCPLLVAAALLAAERKGERRAVRLAERGLRAVPLWCDLRVAGLRIGPPEIATGRSKAAEGATALDA